MYFPSVSLLFFVLFAAGGLISGYAFFYRLIPGGRWLGSLALLGMIYGACIIAVLSALIGVDAAITVAGVAFLGFGPWVGFEALHRRAVERAREQATKDVLTKRHDD